MGLGGTKLQVTSHSVYNSSRQKPDEAWVISGGIKPQGMANYGLFQLGIILWLAQSRGVSR